mgnify:CR=1 FL=1
MAARAREPSHSSVATTINQMQVTPLEWAAAQGHEEIVELLLNSQANINSHNSVLQLTGKQCAMLFCLTEFTTTTCTTEL